MEILEQTLGAEIRFGDKIISSKDLYESGAEFYCIYFGAHWAPPCRLFTPVLSEFYKNINSGAKKVEIIFCSIDGNDAAFERNYKEMPFCAIPYTHEQRI